MKNVNKFFKAFSLAEMLVVILIMTIVLAMTMPIISKRAKYKAAQAANSGSNYKTCASLITTDSTFTLTPDIKFIHYVLTGGGGGGGSGYVDGIYNPGTSSSTFTGSVSGGGAGGSSTINAGVGVAVGGNGGSLSSGYGEASEGSSGKVVTGDIVPSSSTLTIKIGGGGGGAGVANGTNGGGGGGGGGDGGGGYKGGGGCANASYNFTIASYNIIGSPMNQTQALGIGADGNCLNTWTYTDPRVC